MEFYKVFFITMTMFFIASMNNPNQGFFNFLFMLNFFCFIIMITLEEIIPFIKSREKSKRRNKRRRKGRRRKGRLRRFRK